VQVHFHAFRTGNPASALSVTPVLFLRESDGTQTNVINSGEEVALLQVDRDVESHVSITADVNFAAGDRLVVCLKATTVSGATGMSTITGPTSASKAFVPTDTLVFVNKNGDTMTGKLTVPTLDVTGALSALGGSVFNEDSADVDFRVEGNGETHLLFADAGNDRVGVGTSAPSVKFHAQDGPVAYAWSPNARTVAIFEGNYDAGAAAGAVVSVVGKGALGYAGIWLGTTNSQSVGQMSYYFNGNPRLQFAAGGSPKMSLLASGEVGINDTTPSFGLDLNGTLRVTGKATFSGGTDPKYTHTERTTEAEIFAFIKRDIPPSKLTGIVAFFASVNGKLSMWGWVPSNGNVFNLITGELEKTVAGLTAADLDYEYRTEYRLDPERGIVMSDEIAIDVPHWRVKTNYWLDQATGQCYDAATNAVPLAEAIELGQKKRKKANRQGHR